MHTEINIKSTNEQTNCKQQIYREIKQYTNKCIIKTK